MTFQRKVTPTISGESNMEYRGASFLVTDEAVQDMKAIYNIDPFDIAEKGIDAMLDSGATAPFAVKMTISKDATKLTITVEQKSV